MKATSCLPQSHKQPARELGNPWTEDEPFQLQSVASWVYGARVAMVNRMGFFCYVEYVLVTLYQRLLALAVQPCTYNSNTSSQPMGLLMGRGGVLLLQNTSKISSRHEEGLQLCFKPSQLYQHL